MHNTESELNVIDREAALSPDLMGQECGSCFRLLRWKFYRRDTSYKTGYFPQCVDCESQPKLSMEEHLFRLREQNHSSEAVKRQRHVDQGEFRKTDARRGTHKHCSDILLKLHQLVPNMYVKEGGIEGDLAIYQIAPTPRADWNDRNFKYLGYITFHQMPEYSLYEFDEQRDILIRVGTQGWRDVLLRFVKAELLTEEQCDKHFGRPAGEGSTIWNKRMWQLRNSTKKTPNQVVE